jgi:Holliday junction resolvase RusA-like endonuclease
VDPTAAPLDPTHPEGFPSASVVGAVANLRIFIAGKPIPKGRPRAKVISPKDGKKPFVQVYTETETVAWEETVSWLAKREVMSIPSDDEGDIVLPFDGRVIMDLRFNLPRPPSTPKKILFPYTSKSDVDNLAKAVMDGLQNARILSNDNRVTDLSIKKRFASEDHPMGVEIDITTLPAE